VRNGATLDDGTVVTAELVRQVMDEEMAELGPDFQQAREIFEQVALADEYVDFLTLPAYEVIE
jgi:malate synthase